MGLLVVQQTPYPVTAVGKPRLRGVTGGAQRNPGGAIQLGSLSYHLNPHNAIPIISSFGEFMCSYRHVDLQQAAWVTLINVKTWWWCLLIENVCTLGSSKLNDRHIITPATLPCTRSLHPRVSQCYLQLCSSFNYMVSYRSLIKVVPYPLCFICVALERKLVNKWR